MSISLFDLHADTAYALLGRDLNEYKDLSHNDCHIALDRLANISTYVQCFACYTNPLTQLPQGLSPKNVLELEYQGLLTQIAKHSDRIRLAQTCADILRNKEDAVASAVLTLEGTAGFDYDPMHLETLWQKGFRIVSLGWNERNCLTGSHCTGGGLTDRGREFVLEAQRVGMLIDVSHISDQGFWDIMEITQAPIIATHSNSRAVCDVSRNLTDDMFCAICQTDGVVGINLFTDFIGAPASFDKIREHLFHFLELDPAGVHLALGGDLDGCEKLPVGFDGVQSYGSLYKYLQDSGLNTDFCDKLFWNNAMGVFERCFI